MQEENLRRGPWLEEEDERLVAIVELLGERQWDSLAKASGLRRSGKSCRLRWANNLRPNLKRGRLSAEEQRVVIQLQEQWGNKWSKIARALPGRTDNEIKNYWRSHLRNKGKAQEQSRLQICSASCIGFSKQNVLISKCDTISSDGDYSNSYKENSFGSMDNSFSFNTLELSNFEITSSPYEMRLSDWLLLGGSNEQSEAQGNYPLGYPVAEDGEIASAWDSSFSLWN